MDVLANKTIVKDFLERFPACREKDSKLVANVWSHYLKGINKHPQNIRAWDLLEMLAEEKLPNHESITRAARKLKEKFPHLRGKNHDERMKQEDVIIDQLEKF